MWSTLNDKCERSIASLRFSRISSSLFASSHSFSHSHSHPPPHSLKSNIYVSTHPIISRVNVRENVHGNSLPRSTYGKIAFVLLRAIFNFISERVGECLNKKHSGKLRNVKVLKHFFKSFSIKIVGKIYFWVEI